MNEGVECKKYALDRPIATIQHVSLFEEIGYINNSTKTVYIGLSSGQILTLFPSKIPTLPTNSVQILVRLSSGDSRKFEGRQEIVGKEGLQINEYVINIKTILEKEYVYLNDLDMCFCLDINKIEKFQRKLDRNIDKRIQAEIDGAIHATNTAPIKVFGNDATGTFGVVWIAMHDFVFSADISRNRDLGSYFRLSLGTPSGKYFDYTADIEKIRKGEIEEIVTQDGVIAIGPNEESIRSWQFKQKHSDGIVYTKSELNTLISNEVKKYKNRVEELEIELSKTRSKLLEAQEEVKMYKNLLATRKSIDIDTDKQDWEREKRNWEREKIAFERERSSIEQIRINQDAKRKNASMAADIITSVCKVLAAVIPLSLAIYGAFKKT